MAKVVSVQEVNRNIDELKIYEKFVMFWNDR